MCVLRWRKNWCFVSLHSKVVGHKHLHLTFYIFIWKEANNNKEIEWMYTCACTNVQSQVVCSSIRLNRINWFGCLLPIVSVSFFRSINLEHWLSIRLHIVCNKCIATTHTHLCVHIRYMFVNWECQTMNLNHLGVRWRLLQSQTLFIILNSLKTFTFAQILNDQFQYISNVLFIKFHSGIIMLCYVIHQHKQIKHKAHRLCIYICAHTHPVRLFIS